MNEAEAFRKRVLAVATSSRRQLFLPRPRKLLNLAKPAYGPPGPVLIIGAIPQIDENSWKDIIEVVVADDDCNRLDSTASHLETSGVVKLRKLHLESGNLKLDLDALSKQWESHPPDSLSAARHFFANAIQLALESPAISTEYCSVVYCSALNESSDDSQRRNMIREVYRVLRRGGTASFSVDLSDEPVEGSEMLSEGSFSGALADTGYYGIRIVHRSGWPVSVGEGLETRSYVFEACRGKDGPCLDCRQAAIYRGPWKKVCDDDGHVFERDVRTAICEKTFKLVTSAPYSQDILPVEPYVATPLEKAPPFSCRSSVRSSKITKALSPQRDSEEPENCCS
jgi:arsenite methyltransferase